MRIGIFTDCYYPQINGVVTSIINLQEVLTNLNHEVYIITTTMPGVIDKDKEHIIRIPSIPLLKWSEFRIGLFFKYSKIYNKVKNLNFDIVHTQTEFSMGRFGIFIAKDLKIPSLHTYHTVHEEYTHYISNFGEKPLKKIARIFSRNYVKPFSAVIVPTEKTKNLLLSYGVKNKIHIIPTGINLERFKNNIDYEKITSLRKSIKLKENSFKIIFLGRISKEKNIPSLINSFAEILKQGYNTELVIVGDGPNKNEIEEMVKQLKLESSVFFTNRIPNENVPAYYKLANLFVSTSKTETQGLTIIEAMASGIPILVYDDTNIKGIVKDRQNGLVFKDDKELIEKIQFAINNTEAIKEYANLALKTADDFSSFRFATKIEALYKTLIT